MLTARQKAARLNGRLGGIATAKRHTAQFLETRSSNAGSSCRDLYGNDFYKFIRQRVIKVRQVPQAKNLSHISKEILPTEKHICKVPESKELMLALNRMLNVQEI